MCNVNVQQYMWLFWVLKPGEWSLAKKNLYLVQNPFVLTTTFIWIVIVIYTVYQ